MYQKGRKKGTVRFSLTPSNEAKQAYVAGDFSGWQPVRMRRNKNGEFVAVMPVPPGTHEYKFLVDDDWTVDPENSVWSMNPYGTLNSVVQVA
ncbi:MAG: glycogen-binding domain-containing protein [Phycisphaerae bacterium]